MNSGFSLVVFGIAGLWILGVVAILTYRNRQRIDTIEPVRGTVRYSGKHASAKLSNSLKWAENCVQLIVSDQEVLIGLSGINANLGPIAGLEHRFNLKQIKSIDISREAFRKLVSISYLDSNGQTTTVQILPWNAKKLLSALELENGYAT